MLAPLAAPVGRLVVTAAASAGLLKALDGGRGPAAARRVAVGVTKAAIRGARVGERAVERTRLSAGDVVAQAYEEMGEQAPVPTAPSTGHTHEH